MLDLNLDISVCLRPVVAAVRYILVRDRLIAALVAEKKKKETTVGVQK